MKRDARVYLWVPRLAAWLLSASIGYAFVLNHWIPGGVFGVAVVAWHWADTKRLLVSRSLLFVAASTLNFAVVLEIARAGLPSAPAFDLLEPSVMVGSVLLPVAHHYVLGLAWKRAVVAIPVVYSTAYATARVVEAIGVGDPWDSVVNPVAAWQLAYLLVTRPPSGYD